MIVFQDLLCQLKTTTQGKGTFLKIKQCIDKRAIVWDKMISICTDDVPAMIRIINGCVAML